MLRKELFHADKPTDGQPRQSNRASFRNVLRSRLVMTNNNCIEEKLSFK